MRDDRIRESLRPGDARKKLRAAATYLATGDDGGKWVEDLAAFGLVLEQQDHAASGIEIDPDDWPGVLAFMESQTQWRYRPNGRLAGLDYQGVKLVMQHLHCDDANTFDVIRTMELAFMDARNDRPQP